MDTLRGNFADRSDPFADSDDFDPAEEETARDAPPPEIGQDERRMQVRAYNHWASLLQDRNFPLIDDLEPDNLPDFGPCSVLLDFTQGIDDPGVSYIGEKLAAECDATYDIRTLSDVPSRSLLSRITDHYMQIIANQAPIGFEAEFVNQRGVTILYRGILLPFSSDDDTIDFIYGVINWKEMADQRTTDELMLQIDQALEEEPAPLAQRHDDVPMADWADGPAAEVSAPAPSPSVLGLAAGDADGETDDSDIPAPSFGTGESFAEHEGYDEDEDEAEETAADWLQPGWAGDTAESDFETDESEEDAESDDADDETAASGGSGPRYASLASLGPSIGTTEKEPIDLELDHALEFDAEADTAEIYELDTGEAYIAEIAPMAGATPLDFAPLDFATAFEDETPEAGLLEIDESEMELGDWLASARELAIAARSSEDRTRNALYEAIGRAYDFSLAAADAPEEFDELVADSGLTAQDRAPMTPIVKLVFGADYDKTRLTEYAAALSYAHRNRLDRGTLATHLRTADGGLKGVVTAERRARREEAGQLVEPLGTPRERIAARLRELEPLGFDAISPEGPEFALVMIRRSETGEVAMLGEVPDEVALVERAARKLLG